MESVKIFWSALSIGFDGSKRGSCCRPDQQVLVPYPDCPPAKACSKMIVDEKEVGKKAQGGGDVAASRFKKPSDELELLRLSRKTFVESTECKINWGVDLFR